MLTPDIKATLTGYFAQLKNAVTIELNTGEHPKRQELLSMLEAIASLSPAVSLHVHPQPNLRSPISFSVAPNSVDTVDTNAATPTVIFSGIPGGHEFNSLVLAILHAGGHPLKLDDAVKNIITGIEQTLRFEVFVSLSCHNCPDVVQALNQFSLLNPNISSEMIDGGLYPELVAERKIQGVPSVYLNGEPFATGKVDTAQLIEKLMALTPKKSTPSPALEAVQDMVVIGAGPAGAAAAIYGARKGLAVTLIGERFGGQVKDTMGIENLISVPQTTGPALTGQLQAHVDAYEIQQITHLKVTAITPGPIKTVHLASGQTLKTKTLIIATGAKWRELGIPGEREYIGKGVAYCPHCDGPFFKDKAVAVIGGGNSGVEAALDLAGTVKHVTVVEFLPELKADQVLVKQLEKRDNITVITHAQSEKIIADQDQVVALRYKNRTSQATHDLEVAGVFVQIGLVPNSDFLGDAVALSPHGEIVIDEKCRTNEAGIYACGDVSTVPFKQIIVAMGEGAKAALSAYEYLLAQ